MADSQAPLISVIMPLYNAADFLDRSVRSVLGQSYENFELVLVDDGSTDRGGEMCDAYAAEDSRVRVVHQPNGGVCAARNTGLRAASGDYIAWLDSDDYYVPSTLVRLMGAIQSMGADVATCNYYNVTGDTKVLRHPKVTRDRLFTREEFVPYVLARVASPVLWCTLMPRRVYEGIQFPEGKTFEDIRVTHRLYERAERIAVVAEPLVYRIHRDESLSRVQNLPLRIDNLHGYIERYEDGVTRWPRYSQAMLVGCSRMLPVLRGFILRAPRSEFRLHREEIRGIHRFFRGHRREILSSCKSLPRRLLYTFEFDCMTSGSRPILALSQAVDNLIRHPESGLRHLPTTLPPFET